MDVECRRTTQLLSAQWDRRLTAVERMALKDHLSDCPGCRNCAGQFEILHQAIRAWRGADVAES